MATEFNTFEKVGYKFFFFLFPNQYFEKDTHVILKRNETFTITHEIRFRS